MVFNYNYTTEHYRTVNNLASQSSKSTTRFYDENSSSTVVDSAMSIKLYTILYCNKKIR